MKKTFITVHTIYAIVICTLVCYYVAYPVYREKQHLKSSSVLRDMYNKKVSETLKNPATEEEKVLFKKLREVVVHNRFISHASLIASLENPKRKKDAIEEMYLIVKKEIARPHKVFLHYSTECNIGLFCSISLPLLLVSLSNIKSLSMR
ncbi:hypothetical protein NEFER03_1607 [Nematocida sp. LUAm3]|nr:hypothetical protein NEFER03_1607 [Nematocida sp. LUAm3]KAI5176133.1 hypothetical protein NEFER02_1954 [Nematocida sp. LUAm2]KAI5179021.1 hypothetical protein NEFER01_1897 [Nematocida sp. LUAm1]